MCNGKEEYKYEGGFPLVTDNPVIMVWILFSSAAGTAMISPAQFCDLLLKQQYMYASVSWYLSQ